MAANESRQLMYYDGDERYVDEWGRALPKWEAEEPNKRGRHTTFAAAAAAALKDLTTERSPFFDALADKWKELFPKLPIRPGRLENGKIILNVRSAPVLFAMRPKLAMIRQTLAKLPGAPAKIDLILEIRK